MQIRDHKTAKGSAQINLTHELKNILRSTCMILSAMFCYDMNKISACNIGMLIYIFKNTNLNCIRILT